MEPRPATNRNEELKGLRGGPALNVADVRLLEEEEPDEDEEMKVGSSKAQTQPNTSCISTASGVAFHTV